MRSRAFVRVVWSGGYRYSLAPERIAFRIVSGSAGNYTITWPNGTAWHEAAANVPNLAGAWNIHGLPTQVDQSGPGLTFTNERDDSSGGYFLSSTRVFANTWNLAGTVSGSPGNYTITFGSGLSVEAAAGAVKGTSGTVVGAGRS